ncbi:MAG: hypothetical protein Terrestrivirus4_145 [Terrestrivirus sp.]|uniref:Uncharacterized protein n=1 Tax=Terrestrivirus sp. TaxID=2487775 RepID=A0A3G4ZMM4_9VIRU|nr:MAG: hypothetical protein Terrestrivirus4_145 [Terrestrivirus sp.]
MNNNNQNNLNNPNEDEIKKKKESKDRYRPIEVFVNGANLTTQRYRNIKDPQLRHSLVLDKFMLSLDFLLGGLQTVCDEDDLPEGLKPKIEKLIVESKSDLQELQEYISDPQKHMKFEI